MIQDNPVLRNGIGMLLGVALGACAWLAHGEPEKSSPSLVEIINAGLLVSRSGQPELGLMLENISDKVLWVSLQFRTPGGRSDCMQVKELGPRIRHFYLCPQTSIKADTEYPVEITVYADLNQTQKLASLSTSLRFDQGDVQTVQKTRKR